MPHLSVRPLFTSPPTSHIIQWVFLCSVFVAANSLAVSQEPIQKYLDDGHKVVWRLDRPEVGKSRREYPGVVFRKYDEVVVRGGGCVDTGGKLPSVNRTWKRYVNPSGDNSDRLYHGRISIPGATAGLVRISGVEGLHLTVNKFPSYVDPSPMILVLGYEDDKYEDNKYDTEHDDGTQKQCLIANDPEANQGRAWLEITIYHHDNPAAVSPQSPIPRAPLDLWWNAVDENYLPLNPDWWVHQNKKPVDTQTGQLLPTYPNSNDKSGCNRFREGAHDFLMLGRSPACTTWDPDVDEANTKSAFCHFAGLFSNSIHGHANWASVTYTGHIYFDVANNGLNNAGLKNKHELIGDGDYDWLFATDGDRGLSMGSVEDSDRARKDNKLPAGVNALALEFSSRETIDRFSGSKWWRNFHSV